MSAQWRVACHPASRLAALALAVASALLVAGCGSKPAATSSPNLAQVAVSGPSLATSVSSASGTSWAIVQMGGSAATFDNFWELFVRPAGAPSWKLATPAGVASNGGLVMAATGAASLVTGFRPSQDLKFSPLAATADGGIQWSQNALLSPGLGDVPDALAGSSGGRLIALTESGEVETSTSLGATWDRLATQQSLADSPAGRTCDVQALTGAAWTPAGSPVVGASCGKAGVAGIFTYSAGAWRLAGPALPAGLSQDRIDVAALATNGTRTTAILAARTGTGTSLLAAWSADGGAHWQLSPALPAPMQATTAAGKPSISIWADGSAGLVLPDGSGAVIGWQSAGWRALPSLPARTATLALGPGGEPQALSVRAGTMTVWQLDAGSSHWSVAQTVGATIPYGTSG
ncbi:MAG TPA: hypothetical protein VGH96_04240 [Streptosporangiaceae bacterium]|jgi:hypothetical protein